MKFVDVTQDLINAVKSLNIGDMVMSDSFALEEAMSSIELMEPKMDPGYLLHETEAESSRTRALLQKAVLSDSDQCRVTDVLIGEIFNWLDGHLFIQTVHCNLFVVDRDLLECKEVSRFCNSVLSTCNELREFVAMTGVCAEEDFVGFMFDVEKVSSSLSPQVFIEESHSPKLGLRHKFLHDLSECTKNIGDRDFVPVCDNMIACIDDILRDLAEPTADNVVHLIDKSVDRHFHRTLLPAGPPRVVPPVKSSVEIYQKWRSAIEALRETTIIVGATHKDPLEVIYKMNRMRIVEGFSNTFVRSCMYHRMYRVLDATAIMHDWMKVCCGANFEECMQKKNSEEWKFFFDDMIAVFGRTVHLLCRSPSRQHRNMDHLLADWSIMQHRAWDMHEKSQKRKSKTLIDSKGLWNSVALIATTLIQIHLLLVIELDLADLHSEEIGILFYLVKKCLRTKLFVLDELLTLNPSNLQVRNEILLAAAEHAACAGLLNIVARIYLPSEISFDVQRLFELRTAPLRAFPIPNEFSLEEYSQERGRGTETTKAIDDALQWIQRLPEGEIGSTPLIRGRLADLKRALILNKMTLMKANESQTFHLELKHHPLVACIVCTDS